MGSQKVLQSTNASRRKQKTQRTPKRSSSLKKARLSRRDLSSHANQTADSIDTPCRQMAQLELKPKAKQPKLLGSKSLSQLIPRKLLFRTSSGVAAQPKSKESATIVESIMKSFPNGAFASDNLEAGPSINHAQSASMLCLPGRSSPSGHLGDFRCPLDECTLGQPNFSPIISKTNGLVQDAGDIVCFSSTRAHVESIESPPTTGMSSPRKDSKESIPKKTEARFKPLKNTTMVLRDVKNSLGLRLRAKQESKAFTKLTNEAATPPTKLYSPFNITDSCSSRLTRTGNNTSFVSADSGVEADTPKRRIVLQHKKHLIHANKFSSFISPTGKLRETVQDVEHFQKCIEDISQAIKARGESKRSILVKLQSEIVRAPPGKSTLSESVGYLDRMIGGGMRDKQFLRPGGRKHGNYNSRPRQQQTDTFNKNTFSDKTKIPVVADIDDANWIEARKRRFPKTNDLHSKPTQPQCINEVGNETQSHPSSNAAQIDRPDKVNSVANVPGRKKTLFEKLTDSE